MKEDIVILGLGGHGTSVADSIIQGDSYNIVGYTDNYRTDRMELEYLGTDRILEELFEKGIKKAAIGVGYLGNSSVRDNMYITASDIGFEFPSIIDPSSVIASDIIIDEGAYIGKGVIINSGSRIGKCSIINSGAIIEHQNVIGDFSHVAVGAVVCGDVIIGNHTFVGANSTIIQGLKIGDNCIIGAGSIVLSDINDNNKMYGTIKIRSGI